MLFSSVFSFAESIFRLDRSGKLQEYCGRSFLRLIRTDKTVALSCFRTADRQLVYVSPHLSVALSRR